MNNTQNRFQVISVDKIFNELTAEQQRADKTIRVVILDTSNGVVKVEIIK